MRILDRRLDHWHEPVDRVSLSFAQRASGVWQGTLDSGADARIQVPGPVRGGTLLTGPGPHADQGGPVIVLAAPEPVSTAFTLDPRALARATWHLARAGAGLGLGDTWLRYPADPALDALAQRLGLRVFQEHAPYEPETDDPDAAPPLRENVFEAGIVP